MRKKSEIVPGLKGLSGKSYNPFHSIDLGSDDSSSSGFKHYCVETCYGLWAPTFFSEKIEEKISAASEQKGEKVTNAQLYFETKRRTLMKHAKISFTVIDELAEESGIALDEPIKKRLQRLRSFLDDKQEKFENKKWRMRYARAWQEATLPNFRLDSDALEQFEDSFFEYLAYLSSLSQRKAVYKHFQEDLGIPMRPGQSSKRLKKLFYDHFEQPLRQ